jgi:hypothetical protein
MTSPALQRMAERAKLPVRASYDPSLNRYIVSLAEPGVMVYRYIARCVYPEQATRAYLALCESLSDPADQLPSAGTAADCSAPVAPIGVR